MRFTWGGGKVRMALAYGVPFGLYMGLFFWAQDGGPLAAVAGGAVVTGGLFGAWMTVYWTRKCSDLWSLPPADRLAVVTAVARGENVGDPRLAPHVVELADVIRIAADQDVRFRWLIRALVLVAVVWVVVQTANGWDRSDLFAWAIVLLGVPSLLLAPWIAAKRRANADRAVAAVAELTA